MVRPTTADSLKAQLRRIGASKAATAATDTHAWLSLTTTERLDRLAAHCMAMAEMSRSPLDDADDEYGTWQRVSEQLRRASPGPR